MLYRANIKQISKMIGWCGIKRIFFAWASFPIFKNLILHQDICFIKFWRWNLLHQQALFQVLSTQSISILKKCQNHFLVWLICIFLHDLWISHEYVEALSWGTTCLIQSNRWMGWKYQTKVYLIIKFITRLIEDSYFRE